MTAGATRILSEFVSTSRRNELPDDLFELARLYVLDAIGSMLIGATKPWSQIVARFSTGAGGSKDGCCTVIGSPRQTAPQMAAFANGTMAHGFEIDDVHDESLTHPGAVVVPAALAVAEQVNASGADFLMSVVLGYEINGRAGLGVGAVTHMLGGFYPTGTAGVFGATAAATRLLGCDAETTAYAFGIAGSFASGVVEFANSGGMVKRLHAGRAAEGGVTAAFLARDGFTGPPTVLEGQFGFCRAFSKEPDLDQLVTGLGSDFKIRYTTIKPYACCSDIHPVIDALLEIKAKSGLDASRVKNILVESTTKLFNLNNIDGTSSMMAAQYSVPLTAAIVLMLDISDPAVYNPELLANPDLAAFQQKVKMSISPEFDQLYPKATAARVTVTLDDGSTIQAVNKGAAGSIHNPLSSEQIKRKFLRIAEPILSAPVAGQVLSLVEGLDNARDMHALARALRCDVLQPRTIAHGRYDVAPT